jgi:hypothetical protein
MSSGPTYEPSRHLWIWTGCALVLYVALTVVITWPLVTGLDSRVPHDLGDPLLSTWNLWWNAQHVPFSSAWWEAPQFFPAHGTIAFSDHRVGISLISQPLQWLGISPLLTYNLALLGSFPLSALAAHLLVLSLTGRSDAAIISGLAFGFSPYRIAHIEHLELVSSYWMPIVLLALHQYLKRPEPRFAALFCVAWLLQSLCSSYYLFFFSVFISLWFLWFLPGTGWRRSTALLVSWFAAGLSLLPVLLKYREIHQAHGLMRTLTEVEIFSADITAVLSASPLLAVWHSSPRFLRTEGQLFPGAFAIAVVIACLIATRSATRDRRWGWRHAALLLGLAFGLVALTAPWFAPWSVTLGGMSISVSSFRKPLSLAAACMVLYVVLHPRIREAYRQKSLFAFYVLAAMISWVLTWGPAPKLLGTPVIYQAPYAWLMRLPGFSSGLRVPARFAMPAVLALSIAAGLAFARLVLGATRRALYTACFVLIAGGIAADGWMKGLPTPPAPSAWTSPLPSSDYGAVLELPLAAGSEIDAAAVYRSIFHLHPTLNGFSGFFPPYYSLMQLGFESGDQRVLSAIATWGRILIAIDHRNDPKGDWVRYVSAHDGVVAAGSSGTWSFFLLPEAAAERPPAMTGGALVPQRITSNFASSSPANLLDDDPFTRWATPGPQRGSEQLIVDLGAAKEVSGIVLSLGRYALDFPRLLVIETSLDGERWITAWDGPTVALSVAAALSDPGKINLEFRLNAPTARFIRLRQTHADAEHGWSIAKLSVFGTSA